MTLQYCDQEIVPLGRSQPIKIVYLLSLSILIGRSKEIHTN